MLHLNVRKFGFRKQLDLMERVMSQVNDHPRRPVPYVVTSYHKKGGVYSFNIHFWCNFAPDTTEVSASHRFKAFKDLLDGQVGKECLKCGVVVKSKIGDFGYGVLSHDPKISIGSAIEKATDADRAADALVLSDHGIARKVRGTTFSRNSIEQTVVTVRHGSSKPIVTIGVKDGQVRGYALREVLKFLV